jgi:hypothetical protein
LISFSPNSSGRRGMTADRSPVTGKEKQLFLASLQSVPAMAPTRRRIALAVGVASLPQRCVQLHRSSVHALDCWAIQPHASEMDPN